MGNKSNAKKVIEDIKENYRKMEMEIATQLNYQVNNHHLTAGTHREEIWVDFFRRIVPKKFNIARSVFIIDSQGSVSNEVDIAIYDEQYTPYVFNYGHIKFIPVEAVAAVVQCKSQNLDKNTLEEWAESLDTLKTSKNSIVRLATYTHIGLNSESKFKPNQTATKPIKILCYIPKDKSNTDNTRGRDNFDIVIEAYQKNPEEETKEETTEVLYDGNLKITFKDDNLLEVLQKYNQADKKSTKSDSDENLDETSKMLKDRKVAEYKIRGEVEGKEQEYTLLSFIFQFNQMLMMINNPMFFPHKAYVDMFNGKSMKDKNTKEK